MNKFLLGALFVFGNSFAAEQRALLYSIPEDSREYDTFVGQAQTDLSDVGLKADKKARKKETIILVSQEGEIQRKAKLGLWCNKEVSGPCCKPCSRSLWFCCGLTTVVFAGVTALCLWKLEHYDPTCDGGSC